jgi:alkylation response protein AidB-like acyl-CoA dehydrogenase
MPLLQYGTPQQQAQYLPMLSQGPFAAFALTEANSGSEANAAQSTVVHQADGMYCLNGHKQFISNAQQAPLFVVFAQLKGRLTTFLLPAPTPGLTVLPGDDKLGLNDSAAWGQLHFDHVILPPQALLGQAGHGLGVAKACLDGGRIGIAAIALGLTHRCLTWWQQQQPLSPLATSQLAHYSTQQAAAMQLVGHAAWLKYKGLPVDQAASMAKLFATQLATCMTDYLLDSDALHNPPKNHPVLSAWADAKALTLVEGTNEIQHLIIAKKL